MVKFILLGLAGLLLIGCSNNDAITTKTVEVKVPLLYCPAPPTIDRPVLPIQMMTPEQKKSDGEIAKHYKASMHRLITHSTSLEKALNHYFNINTSYDELKKKIEKIEQNKPTD